MSHICEKKLSISVLICLLKSKKKRVAEAKHANETNINAFRESENKKVLTNKIIHVPM